MLVTLVLVADLVAQPPETGDLWLSFACPVVFCMQESTVITQPFRSGTTG
jgi:hypothetical protein